MKNKRTNANKWILFGCVILLIAILIVAFVYLMLYEPEDAVDPSEPSVPVYSGSVEETNEEASEIDDEPTQADSAAETEGTTADSSQVATQNATEGGDEPVTPATVVQQLEAPYEEWLSAAAVIGVSMNYPDFEIQGIYAPEQTALTDKMNSDGVYVLFTSGGKSLAVHCYPLEAERKTAGTTDLSTQNLGFNAFDLVDPALVDTASMRSYTIEELNDLIAQSLLVSLYIH